MAQRIAIIDYGSGNLRSVEKALALAAREAGLPCVISVTDDPNEIRRSDRLLLPGVGAYGACMAGLSAADGVLEAIQHVVLVESRPFLGVCVGMQLLSDQGFEFERSDGLGWIAGAVRPLKDITKDLRVPHMGWNEVAEESPHELFAGLDGDAFYFAHSFYFDCENSANVLCSVRYGAAFPAGVIRDNIAGVQFHPEKSQHAGARFLANFLSWSP